MRTSPLLGEKVWFGPRRFGWGLDPVSVEGWAVTAIVVSGSVLANRHQHARRTRTQAMLGAALVAAAVLKGTTPGGPRARRAYQAARQIEP